MIIGESVAKQHRLAVSKLIMWTKWRKEVKPGKERLKEKFYYDRFRTEVLGSGVMEGYGDWEVVAEVLSNTARDVLSETSGKGDRADRDTWWWKKEVQDGVKVKKEAKKLWDSTRDEVTKERYKRARKEVKREVAKAKNDIYTKNCTKDWRRRKEKWNCSR